jgi:hypothetical protein
MGRLHVSAPHRPNGFASGDLAITLVDNAKEPKDGRAPTVGFALRLSLLAAGFLSVKRFLA